MCSITNIKQICISWLMPEGASSWPEVQTKHKPNLGRLEGREEEPRSEPVEEVLHRAHVLTGAVALASNAGCAHWDLTAAPALLTATTGEHMVLCSAQEAWRH